MSDTAVTPTNGSMNGSTNDTMPAPAAPPAAPDTAPTDGFFLDGDAPRLGAASPLTPPAPLGDGELGTAAPTTQPSSPEPARFANQLADIDPADLPSLPSTAPVPADDTETTGSDDDETTASDEGDAEATDVPEHPMAHLMPPKSKPSEASLKAAQIRAEKKAKAKKVKIGVALGALIVSVLVGPPLFSWLSNAINEAGGTTSEPTD